MNSMTRKNVCDINSDSGGLVLTAPGGDEPTADVHGTCGLQSTTIADC